MAKKKLTPKQKLFVLEYLKDFNGSQAAIRAGYSEKTATVIASENLTKPDILSEIEIRMNEIIGDKNKLIIENINFWKEIKDSADVETANRLRASENLGRFTGMFNDKLNLNLTGKLETENKTINYSDLPPEEAKKLFFDKISGADNNGD